MANETPGLQAICIDVSFSSDLQEIADVSFHLTPTTLVRELEKLSKRVPILLHHLKPPCIDAIKEEIAALGNPDIGFLEQGKVYEF